MISLTSVTQRQWAKASARLGLVVDKKKGKGSHYRVENPASGKMTTLPHDCHKFINIEIYKTFMEWGFSEEEIDNALK